MFVLITNFAYFPVNVGVVTQSTFDTSATFMNLIFTFIIMDGITTNSKIAYDTRSVDAPLVKENFPIGFSPRCW